MSYAINSTNTGWRAVNSQADLVVGETFSATLPVLLAQIQLAQVATVAAAYQSAISQPVSFTTAGKVSKTFQADPGSIANLQGILAAFTASTLPTGFYWVSQDNTQVPVTYADLQGLAAAMGAQGWTAFQRLQTAKAAIAAATTAAAVQAVAF